MDSLCGNEFNKKNFSHCLYTCQISKVSQTHRPAIMRCSQCDGETEDAGAWPKSLARSTCISQHVLSECVNELSMPFALDSFHMAGLLNCCQYSQQAFAYKDSSFL